MLIKYLRAGLGEAGVRLWPCRSYAGEGFLITSSVRESLSMRRIYFDSTLVRKGVQGVCAQEGAVWTAV